MGKGDETVGRVATEIEVAGLGICHAVRHTLNGGCYQWRITFNRKSVLGDFSTDNKKALASAFMKLKIRFKLK